MLSSRYATSPESSHAGYPTTKGPAQQGYSRSDGAPTLRIPFRYGGGRLQRLETTTHRRLHWSEPMWSPPPESNRRPHPYHGSAAKRCASQCLRSSRRTVGGQGMCSVADRLGGAGLGGCGHYPSAGLRVTSSTACAWSSGRLQAGVVEPAEVGRQRVNPGRWRFAAAGRARTARPSAALAAPRG